MPSPHETAALERAGIACTAGADGRLVLRGRTFPVRAALRGSGGRWDPATSSWTLEEAALPAVLAALHGGCLAEAPACGFDLAGATRVAGWWSRLLGRAPAPAPVGPSTRPWRWGSRHFHGHRKRLRHRAFEAGTASLPDYELLELLLFFSVRRIDTKPLAKALLERFGSLGAVLAADRATLAELDWSRGDGTEENLAFTASLLAAVHELVRRVTREPLRERPLIGSPEALLDYLRVSLAHDVVEHFRVLFLDAGNGLIRDEQVARGTVDQVPIYPREVAKRALELAAAAVVLVHNHPSGDPTPSFADIETTRQVQAALTAVDVALHDHLIIGAQGHASLRAAGAIR